MRRVLILALLTAAAVPTAAVAQESGSEEVSREQRREARQERRQQRQEVRQQRQEAPAVQRQERREQRQEARQQRQQAPAVVQRQERRAERIQPQRNGTATTWIGNPNDPRMEAHRRRYEQLDRENARRNGTPEQYRALVADQRAQRGDRRDDRRETRQERREDRRDFRQDRREDRRETRQDWRQDRREWRQDRREDRRDWNRDWRRDNRYDWQRYRNSNRFVFRVQPYYAPYRGYNYSRFSIGSLIDRLFWGQNYWIHDPWQYRLPAAPYGYQWVRYYNDVILVDTFNGRVVDVIYDFFW